jgi:hypothetical protein
VEILCKTQPVLATGKKTSHDPFHQRKGRQLTVSWRDRKALIFFGNCGEPVSGCRRRREPWRSALTGDLPRASGQEAGKEETRKWLPTCAFSSIDALPL